MRRALSCWFLTACGEPVGGTPDLAPPALRLEVDAEPALGLDVPAPVPTCEPPPAECAQQTLDPSRCIVDASPFELTVVDGFVADVHVDAHALAELALPPGRWWTAFPDPLGGCEWRVVEVEIGDVENPS